MLRVVAQGVVIGGGEVPAEGREQACAATHAKRVTWRAARSARGGTACRGHGLGLRVWRQMWWKRTIDTQQPAVGGSVEGKEAQEELSTPGCAAAARQV